MQVNVVHNGWGPSSLKLQGTQGKPQIFRFQICEEAGDDWISFTLITICFVVWLQFQAQWNPDAKSKDLLYESFVFYGRLIHDLCFLCPSICKACKIETSLRVKIWGFQFQIFESGRFEETGGSIPMVWLWWVQRMHILAVISSSPLFTHWISQKLKEWTHQRKTWRDRPPLNHVLWRWCARPVPPVHWNECPRPFPQCPFDMLPVNGQPFWTFGTTTTSLPTRPHCLTLSKCI